MEIFTGLTDNKSYEILQSVMGQLSDGIWENSPRMEKYWRGMDIAKRDDGIYIIVHNNWKLYDFRQKGEAYIASWFANKAKEIIKIEREDGNYDLVWNRNNEAVSQYIGYDEAITVADVYVVYDVLKGRVKK